jgi:cation:H+ antiporter
MSASILLLLLVGFALLVGGAELLVRGASRIAIAVGISPLVVGLTIVSLGTSAPEISVSLDAAMRGQGDLAIGNVVGSNTFNILFSLGIAAVITPLMVDRRLVRREVPIMIAAGIALFLLTIDGSLDRFDGAVLFAGLVAFLAYMLRSAKKEVAVSSEPDVTGPRLKGPRGRIVDIGLIVVGLALLAVGSHWLVDGASQLARAFGVSELVIGLTVVAAGTGLPEVATSVVAALRGQRDIAVGNAVGSNVFNILAVLGITGLIAPGGVDVAPAALNFDIPVMVVTLLITVPIFFSGWRISRLEGLLFVGLYVAYGAYLVLDARGYDALPAFSGVMMLGVLPVATIVVAVTTLHSVISARRTRRRDELLGTEGG